MSGRVTVECGRDASNGTDEAARGPDVKDLDVLKSMDWRRRCYRWHHHTAMVMPYSRTTKNHGHTDAKIVRTNIDLDNSQPTKFQWNYYIII